MNKRSVQSMRTMPIRLVSGIACNRSVMDRIFFLKGWTWGFRLKNGSVVEYSFWVYRVVSSSPVIRKRRNVAIRMRVKLILMLFIVGSIRYASPMLMSTSSMMLLEIIFFILFLLDSFSEGSSSFFGSIVCFGWTGSFSSMVEAFVFDLRWTLFSWPQYRHLIDVSRGRGWSKVMISSQYAQRNMQESSCFGFFLPMRILFMR